MGRRPVVSSVGFVNQFRQQRMAPGGRRWSESPIPAPAYKRPRAPGAAEVVYPASLMGYNSASPPYKIWVMDWNNNLPADLSGTGFLRMTLSTAVADSTVAVVVEGFTNGAVQYVLLSGGPFASGEVVSTATFPVDMAGFDSSEGDVLLPASVGFYSPWYDAVPRTSGDFQTSTADLVMLS